jgi:hypothetical protein
MFNENVHYSIPIISLQQVDKIKTTSEPPISLRPYRIPYARCDEVKKLLNQMLKDGHIGPSKSPWSSPIVLIDKNDGSIRLCVDYRKLNDITQSDGYPIPRIDEIISIRYSIRPQRNRWF